MKRFISFAIAVVVAVAVSACIVEKRHAEDGSLRDGQVSMTFKVDSFERIDLGGSVTLVFTQGATDSLRVECAEGDRENIAVEQSGNRLRITKKGRERNSSFRLDDKVVAYVSSPTLSRIEVSGACGIKMKEPVKFGNLRVVGSGASDIEIRDIAADALRIETSGAANVKIDDATVVEFFVGISGAGNMEAKLRKSELVDVQVSGAGDIDLELEECGDVKCQVSGAGKIDLSGDARSVDTSTSGAGRVSKSGLRIGGGR